MQIPPSVQPVPSNNDNRTVSIPFGDLCPGTLISRPNRFLAVVDLNNKIVEAHVPDPGRLEELLFAGNNVMVRRAEFNPKFNSRTRKTAYDLVLAAFKDIWVCIDTRYPNDIFEIAVREKALEDFRKYTEIHREVTFERAMKLIDPKKGTNSSHSAYLPKDGQRNYDARKTPKSRFDFLLLGPKSQPFLVEVKSVNLCVDGTGLFPDAPTKRGARHVRELLNLLSEGIDTGVLFIAQREDVTQVSAHRQMDPEFALALDEAQEAGVKIMAYRCVASQNELRLDPQPIPYAK
jgi:sugar fermentation stimulation protein A